MTGLRQGLDFAVDFVTACLWALAAFFVGTRLMSHSVGFLLAIAVFITAMTYVLGTRNQERRARHIAAGACPHCSQSLTTAHEHRRWDTTHQEWLAPLTTWHCEACDFQQEAPIACETCPRA